MKVMFVTKPIFMEPLGIMYLAAAAKNNGHTIGLGIVNEGLEDKVSRFNPDVVGYSVMTGDQEFYLSINAKLRKDNKFISIFGGPHPTFFPEMIEREGVDIVCRGEGESAFSELLDCLSNEKDYSGIENLCVRTARGIKTNPVRNFSDIDSIPFPDREIIGPATEAFEGPIKHFIASRGCPFQCSYCFNESYSELYAGKGKRVRFRSPESVVDEVKRTVGKYPSKFVYFQDDTFTLNVRWLEEFSEFYAKEIGMPYHCHVRANTLTEKITGLLKKSGCYSAHIAAETANDRLRNEVLKRGMSYEQIVTASGMLRDSGIRFMMQSMIGLPTGNLGDDLKTLEMNNECKPDYAWVSIFQPYPGTWLGEFSRRNGIYTGDFSDIGSNFYGGSPLNFPDEYKNQLMNLQKLFAVFVENPSLVKSGVAKWMINQRSENMGEMYSKLYKDFRRESDKRLYGFYI